MFKLLAPSAKRARARVTSSLLTLSTFALLAGALPCRADSTLFYSGNLRNDATVTSCGTSCVLNAGNSDSDYAQWAAVVNSFNVADTSTMMAITYSYGGGNSLTGPTVTAGGLEPYLSLFDASGNFLASTYFGTTCPTGAGTYDGNCYDVALDGGTLTAGTYYLALTAYANMSLAENYGSGTLADGFTGLGGLALDEDLHYGYDVVLTSTERPISPVPEPNFNLLVGVALAPLFAIAKKKLRR